MQAWDCVRVILENRPALLIIAGEPRESGVRLSFRSAVPPGFEPSDLRAREGHLAPCGADTGGTDTPSTGGAEATAPDFRASRGVCIVTRRSPNKRKRSCRQAGQRSPSLSDFGRAVEAATALAEVGRELVGTLDPGRVTHLIVDAVMRLLRSRSAALYQVVPESAALRCLAVAGGGDARQWVGKVLPAGGCASVRGRPGTGPWSACRWWSGARRSVR